MLFEAGLEVSRTIYAAGVVLELSRAIWGSPASLGLGP